MFFFFRWYKCIYIFIFLKKKYIFYKFHCKWNWSTWRAEEVKCEGKPPLPFSESFIIFYIFFPFFVWLLRKFSVDFRKKELTNEIKQFGKNCDPPLDTEFQRLFADSKLSNSHYCSATEGFLGFIIFGQKWK